MNINETVNAVHAMAKEKGWWDEPNPAFKIHTQVREEIDEATDEVRRGYPPLYKRAFGETKWYAVQPHDRTEWMCMEDEKPEGEAVELVDAVLRIMDYFGHKGWNMEHIIEIKMQYNSTRPYRHGKTGVQHG